MATFDGDEIFGEAVTTIIAPRRSGGSRVIISGVLAAPDIGALTACENILLDYADCRPRVFVDNRGREWPDTIFAGDYAPSPMGPRPLAGGGWCLPYRLTMEIPADRAITPAG